MFSSKPRILFKVSVLAICILSIVYLFILHLNKCRGNAFRIYGDIEQSLCEKSVGRDKHCRLGRCPKNGIVTVVQGGRLGNQMWEYASVWAVARLTGLEPYVPGCIRFELEQFFEPLSVPIFEEIAHCPSESTTFVKSIEEWNSTDQSIILHRYIHQPKLVLPWRQDIVKEFKFRKELENKAHQILRGLVENLPRNNYTFIGVHVRRTDYFGYLRRKYNESLVSPQFFSNAMAHFKRKYPNCLFVFVSDDPDWCYNQFGKLDDVIIASDKVQYTPAIDMAIMASCNHTIIDYGTFGEWGAILTGGDTVYYNMTQSITRIAAEFMKNWITLS